MPYTSNDMGGTADMKTPFDRFERVLRGAATGVLIAAVAGGLAGCASGGPVAEGSVAQVTAMQRSPAVERVISGVADIVLTDRVWDTFAQAQANPVSNVRDGGRLYAHLRASRPLGDLAHPGDPNATASFARYPHLFLQVGDNESLRIISTCYVTLTPDESRRTEIVVPLAPLTYRPGDVPADCWLTAVSTQRPGAHNFEVRLAGFAGKFERWLPVPDLLGVAPIAAQLDAGAGQYATMLKAPPMRNATMVATAVATPVRGSSLVSMNTALPAPPRPLGVDRMDQQLQTLAAALLGRRPTTTYFVDDNWTSNVNGAGQVVSQHAFAVAIFKGENCSWTRLKVFRRPNARSIGDVEQAGEPIEVGCSELR